MTFEDIWGWINFPLGLLAAEFIIGMRLPKRKHAAVLFILGCIPALAMSLVWKYIPFNGLWGGTMIFFIIFLLSMVMPIATFNADIWSYLFVGVIAYSAQHISYQLYNIVNTLVRLPLWGQIIILVAFSAAVYVALYFAFTRKRKKGETIPVYNVILLIVSGLTLTVTVVISFIGGAYAFRSGFVALPIILSVFSIISCLLSIFMGFSICFIKESQVELSVLKHMFYEAQKQYENSKESIDIINIKCHDLKHQIYSLKGKMEDHEFSGISQAITIYDNSFKTGNVALDTVLTEKALICQGKGIRLTCLVDGSSLDGMKQSDIYSFFGNAIDNAIEGVSREEEINKVISIREVKRKGFSIITIENFHTGEIVFENGLPQTTKEDKDYHGFGMKSMKMIAEQYGGEFIVSFADHIFKLQLILAHK